VRISDIKGTQKGYQAELFADKILESKGFEILIQPKNEERWGLRLPRRYRVFHLRTGKTHLVQTRPATTKQKEIMKTRTTYLKKLGNTVYPKKNSGRSEIYEDGITTPTYVDYFCKKKDKFYLVDIKHKTYKENRNLNQFYVTDLEVLNYERIKREDKIEIKIMIILEKGNNKSFRIYDWDDFRIPLTYNPQKSHQTSIRLKDGLDLDSLEII